MNHLTTYWIIACLVMAAVAFFIVMFIKDRISETLRTFELHGTNGAKVTFTVGEDEDFSDVVSSQLIKLDAQIRSDDDTPLKAT